jgi:transposase-like protein
MARREYSEETKAAVMAALLAGQSISSVAKEYRIPKSTVANWSAGARREFGTVPNPKKEEIGDRLIEYLNAALVTLRKQVEAFGDESWIKRQNASEVAVLHGVLADKTIRLLEALAGSAEGDG